MAKLKKLTHHLSTDQFKEVDNGDGGTTTRIKARLQAILTHFEIDWKKSDNEVTLRERYNCKQENRDFVKPKPAANPFAKKNKPAANKAAIENPPAAKPAASPKTSEKRAKADTATPKPGKGLNIIKVDGKSVRIKPTRTSLVVDGKMYTSEEAMKNPSLIRKLVKRKSRYLQYL